jgi:hypothetical protein
VFQRRTLVRARDLAAFRAALVDLATAGRPLDARRRAVGRAHARVCRVAATDDRGAVPRVRARLPDAGLRDAREFIERLARATPRPTVLLSRAEREVLLERAARLVADRPRSGGAPFQVRPGLVSADARFLRRAAAPAAHSAAIRPRGVRAAARRARSGRGTDSLIQQTCFLGFTFLAYERAVAASGAMDEHGLHDALLETQPPLPFDHLVVAVADHPSDPRGLWPADFDLIGRLRHLARVDVVVTDGLHDAGFRERIEEELPGIEEARVDSPAYAPVLRRPAGAADEDIAVGQPRSRGRAARRSAHDSRARRGRRSQSARPHGDRLSPAVAVSLSVSTSSDRGSGAVPSLGRACRSRPNPTRRCWTWC